MKKPRKLDIIHDVMPAVDKRDMGFLERQEPDAKKEFAPPVVLRWASAVRGPQAENYVWLVNEIANVDFHVLHQHPELQYKLIAMCGCGKRQDHQWIPPAKVTRQAPKLHAFLSKYHPLASAKEIDLLINLHTLETFIEFVNGSGADPQESKDLIDAFKKKLKADG